VSVLTVDEVIAVIEHGFSRTTRPSAAFLQGSFDGCEPAEAVAPFLDVQDWREIPATTLDAYYTALSFFSEAGFRFFLPAFMVADVRDQLQTADPVFHLTHGFRKISVDTPNGSVTSGGTTLLNPKRYGAITWDDHARFRLSVFTREESQAIVAYLMWRRDNALLAITREEITVALDQFWIGRSETAPVADALGGS
jgi:hypothetical protein